MGERERTYSQEYSHSLKVTSLIAVLIMHLENKHTMKYLNFIVDNEQTHIYDCNELIDCNTGTNISFIYIMHVQNILVVSIRE